MSSELDKLVEAVTDLVMAEIGRHAGSVQATPPAPPDPTPKSKPGTKVLVCPGPQSVDSTSWNALAKCSSLSPAVLVWDGFRADQLAGPCAAWTIEARCGQFERVVSGYKAVVLLGGDLSVLSGIANLGNGGAPSAAAVAGLAAGLPVFVDNGHYEAVRRHSSRLASGFVRRFEEFYRMVHSFGVEFGGSTQLPDFLARLDSGAPAAPSDRSGGRAVVTVEDVQALRQAGTDRLQIAIGTIVTPLASQKAAEWGIEVVFQ